MPESGELNFTTWSHDVRRILTLSIGYHYPNFDEWRQWFDDGKTAQEAADCFLRMLALAFHDDYA